MVLAIKVTGNECTALEGGCVSLAELYLGQNQLVVPARPHPPPHPPRVTRRLTLHVSPAASPSTCPTLVA